METLTKIIKNFAFLFIVLFSVPAYAATTLVGLSTDGTVYQIDVATGAITALGGETITSFSLGGIARKKDLLYYVAAPAGTSENAIYTFNLKTNSLSKVDINRVAGDDEVRLMFLKGKKLFAIFYNGTAGTAGLYRLDPVSGAATLVRDFSDLNVEISGGSFAKVASSYYTTVRPESSSLNRQLLKFTANSKAPVLTDIKQADGTAVLCDRIKTDNKLKNFYCLAAPSTSQVDFCKVAIKTGITKCNGTLTNIQRIGGGHTMLSPDGKKIYAIAYETGDQNSQRLITLTAKGTIKSSVTVNAILVGAQFDQDNEVPVSVK